MDAVRRRPALLAVGVAALAVFAACLHTVLPVLTEDVGTRGYRLDPPRSVGAFQEERRFGDTYVGRVRCGGMPSDSDCELVQTEVGGIGITPSDARRIVVGASGTGADYEAGEPGGEYSRYLVFRGLQGNVPDPDAALRAMFRSIDRGEQSPFRPSGEKWDGPPRPVRLDGYEGAVMRCRGGEDTYQDVHGTVITRPVAMCVWADHSTVAATALDTSVQELRRLTTELYRTARVKK